MEVYVPVTAQKQISGISNKMFTNRQGIRKGWLISRKIFPVVPKGRIQIKREEEIALEYSAKL
jgi:hypothetical protein